VIYFNISYASEICLNSHNGHDSTTLHRLFFSSRGAHHQNITTDLNIQDSQ